MKKLKETQTATITWSASGDISADLLRSGYITRITATMEITPSATLTATNQPDGLWRPWRRVTVSGGAKTYFSGPADAGGHGGTLLHVLNMVDGFGPGHKSGAITNPNRTYQAVNMVYHCGTRPRWNDRDNPFDLSALIPAVKESQLRATWTTGPNSVMDDAVTISSAVMRFTIHHILGTDAEIMAEIAAQGIPLPPGVQAMMPAWTSEDFSHSATGSDYSVERNLPTGGFLSRIALIDQDETATRPVRAEDQVTGVAVKNKRENTDVLKSFLDAEYALLPYASNTEADDAAADFQAYTWAGVQVRDLRPHMLSPYGREYGLALGSRGIAAGDFVLGLTVSLYTSGDDTLILYERREPLQMVS